MARQFRPEKTLFPTRVGRSMPTGTELTPGRLSGWRMSRVLSLGLVALALTACGSATSNGTSSSASQGSAIAAGTSSSAPQGASTDAGTSAGASGGASVAGKKVILVHCGDVNPWCAVYNKTIIAGLKAAGADVQYLQDPFDVALEIQNLQTAIAAHPALILVSPTDDNSLVPSLQQAKAQGVPVIINNSMPAAAAKDLVTATINADQASLGTYAAQNIVEGLQAEGLKTANVIAITGSDATATSGDRMAAFKAELAKTPGYKLVEEKNGNWDPALTGQIASQLFAQYRSQGGIQAAYGMADYMANAIIQSAQQASLPLGVKNKGLIVTGSNCFKVGIDNIKAGMQYGTATQTPDSEGNYVVKLTLQFLGGATIPAVNLNKEDRVTAANVDTFAAGCSKA
jgi:ABC-type sugar transport system substrate-binding protein